MGSIIASQNSTTAWNRCGAPLCGLPTRVLVAIHEHVWIWAASFSCVSAARLHRRILIAHRTIGGREGRMVEVVDVGKKGAIHSLNRRDRLHCASARCWDSVRETDLNPVYSLCRVIFNFRTTQLLWDMNAPIQIFQTCRPPNVLVEAIRKSILRDSPQRWLFGWITFNT